MSVTEQALPDLQVLDEILSDIPDVGSSDLIPILQKIQNSYGYLVPNVLMEMSRRTGIPASRIYGVATFYEQFHLEPHGRHTIRCCRGTACHVRGGPDIADAITRAIGAEPGGTTDDMRFTFETVACLGTCFLAPVIMVNNDYYGNLNSGKIEEILNKYE